MDVNLVNVLSWDQFFGWGRLQDGLGASERSCRESSSSRWTIETFCNTCYHSLDKNVLEYCFGKMKEAQKIANLRVFIGPPNGG